MDLGGDGIKGVEQKVRMQLRLQRVQLRAGQMGFQQQAPAVPVRETGDKNERRVRRQ